MLQILTNICYENNKLMLKSYGKNTLWRKLKNSNYLSLIKNKKHLKLKSNKKMKASLEKQV